MQAFEAFKRFFRPSDATIALPGDAFIVIDRERAIEKLKLDERAERNGALNFPPPSADGLDDVEAEIVAEIEEHATRAQIDATANHRLYGERLSELALLRELSTITGATVQAAGDFQATVINRQGRLSLAKDAIRESHEELREFKLEHNLRRPAHRGLHPAYAWSTVLVSLVIESAANTAFLRVNDDFGLIGGFVAAVIVSAVNVLMSFMVGRYWWPYLFYRYKLPKVAAMAGCVVWIVGLITWNLLAGHFRDAKAGGLNSPETAALQLLAQGPLHFQSIYSYGLLVAGFCFALLSATAGFKKGDPYPGYGAIYGRHEDRCDAYADEIEDALDELRDTRDDAIGKASDIRDQLGVQFRERGQIIAAREANRSRYREHQDYLESVANFLLSYYRAANMRARTDGLLPSHFQKTWELKRTELPHDPPEPVIDNEVAAAQAALDESIQTIAAECKLAMDGFQHIDQLKASLNHG